MNSNAATVEGIHLKHEEVRTLHASTALNGPLYLLLHLLDTKVNLQFTTQWTWSGDYYVPGAYVLTGVRLLLCLLVALSAELHEI